MTTISLEWIGTQELVDRIKAAPEAVKNGLRSAINYLRPQVVAHTPWLTGRTASSWSSVEEISEGYMFGNPLPHTFYLEKGWDPEKKPVGPRTMLYEGRVYSKQAPGGIIGPLVKDEAMQKHLLDRVMAQVMGALSA